MRKLDRETVLLCIAFAAIFLGLFGMMAEQGL